MNKTFQETWAWFFFDSIRGGKKNLTSQHNRLCTGEFMVSLRGSICRCMSIGQDHLKCRFYEESTLHVTTIKNSCRVSEARAVCECLFLWNVNKKGLKRLVPEVGTRNNRKVNWHETVSKSALWHLNFVASDNKVSSQRLNQKVIISVQHKLE